MITAGLFTSTTDNWATPQELFERLNTRYNFTLDPCASKYNHKCAEYYTREQDGLAQDWGGHSVFCNPPYGRNIGKWIKKASEEAAKPNTTVVLLLPARTDTAWFHDYIYKKADVEFLSGRLKFGGCGNSAPFPSMIVTMRKEAEK